MASKASAADTRFLTPAVRRLALMVGIPLILLGVLGLVWHLIRGQNEEFIFSHTFGLDVFHLVMGLLAVAVTGSKRAMKGYGVLAFVVFLLACAGAAFGVALAHEEHLVAGVPHWLAADTPGFTEISYILYALFALWGLLLSRTDPELDPSGSGDAHAAMRALPDREAAIDADRRALTE